MAQLWGGRFTKETDQSVYKFNASIEFDKRLYAQDIKGSIAHVMMLARKGIINETEKEKIITGLTGIMEDVTEGRLKITDQYEDIHSFVESVLIERIGNAGKKLHTGRSRNEAVRAGRASSDRQTYRGAFVCRSWNHRRKSRNLYAGFHTSSESTAHYACTSYGRLF